MFVYITQLEYQTDWLMPRKRRKDKNKKTKKKKRTITTIIATPISEKGQSHTNIRRSYDFAKKLQANLR